MAIITVTAQANEKNTRTVSTAKGDKKIISVPLFEKEKGSSVKVAYGSAFLPDFIQLGDTVTVSGRVQAKESGEYVNYNFVFPTVEKVFINNDNGSQAQAKQGLFGVAEPIEVNTEDLPF
ncbi:ssDNA binding protein [Lactococcus phage RH10]|nr:ssDNA binding protein [Lactococcus phage RH10]